MTKRESSAARVLGRKGGSSKSEAKIKASRDNGKLGGAPAWVCTCGHIRAHHYEEQPYECSVCDGTCEGFEHAPKHTQSSDPLW